MPSLIRNDVAEACLRQLLEKEGYKLTIPKRSNGQTGVDIIAENGSNRLYIEVIGFKSSPPKRSKDFYEVFFRAISRIKLGAKSCIIALPSEFSRGLPQRAKQYDIAWSRIGKAFPELQIWLVDVHTSSYRKTTWNEWLRE